MVVLYHKFGLILIILFTPKELMLLVLMQRLLKATAQVIKDKRIVKVHHLVLLVGCIKL